MVKGFHQPSPPYLILPNAEDRFNGGNSVISASARPIIVY